jgi:hypothetical protein
VTPEGDDPIYTSDQQACLTNALVLGAVAARRGLVWEQIHDKLPELVWALEKAWIAASHGDVAESEQVIRPNNFTEFAEEWLIVHLVVERIES